MVSNLRKTGWDKINEIAKGSLDNDLLTSAESEKKNNEDVENELLDEMRDDEEEIVVESKNPFELLGEEE